MALDLSSKLFDRYGLTAIEVADEAFESPASIVFDQAEDRMHTIKVIVVATVSRDGST